MLTKLPTISVFFFENVVLVSEGSDGWGSKYSFPTISFRLGCMVSVTVLCWVFTVFAVGGILESWFWYNRMAVERNTYIDRQSGARLA